MITVKDIEGLAAGKWLTQSLGYGKGVFSARRLGDGVTFYFRYSLPDGKRDTLKIATYDKNGANGGITLAQAREKSSELSKLYQDHPHLRLYLEEQQHQEKERIHQEQHEREHATLESLLNGYVEHLKLQGKGRTAQDVAGIFRRRVFSNPEIAGLKANIITVQTMTRIIAGPLAAGKGREAAKLRSYLAAAYAAALKADSDPEIPPCLHGFNLTANPAQSVAPLSKYNRPRETHLSRAEFRALWSKLQQVGGVTGAALRLCILLGGQRPFQLLRLTADDVDFNHGRLVLLDTKGNRTDPRRHILPIPDAALSELEPLTGNRPYLFSSGDGSVHLDIKTLSNAVRRICREMIDEGTCTTEFQLRDIRRTIETLLAGMGVSKDIRAQLQSHGLSGVQDRHYDRHLYIEEKLAAMEKIERLLSDESAAKIIPMRAARED